MTTDNWHRQETYKSLIQISTSALRFVVLANGGAAVAILAFLGSAWGGGQPVPNLSITLGFFLAGVFLGGLAHITAYKTQLNLYNESCTSANHVLWLYVSLALVLLGFIAFGVGAWLGVCAISK